MSAPWITPLLKKMRVNLPKRDELLFWLVLALPKASKNGLTPATRSAMLSGPPAALGAAAVPPWKAGTGLPDRSCSRHSLSFTRYLVAAAVVVAVAAAADEGGREG